MGGEHASGRDPKSATDGVVSTVWWVFSLGVVAAFLGGSVASAPTPAAELRVVAAYALVAFPALYAVLARRGERWYDPHPFVRFVVYLLSLFTAVVVLDLAVNLAVGAAGPVARAGEALAFLAGLGVAVWVTLYGGAETAWRLTIDWLDVEW